MWAAIVGAVVGGLVGFGGSKILLRGERRNRVRERAEDRAAQAEESEKRARLEGEVAQLHRTQVDVLDRMADAIRAAVDPAARQKLGAAISLQMVRVSDWAGSTGGVGGGNLRARSAEYLIVKNLGPGGAQITGLTFPTPEHGRPFVDEPVPGGTIELLPGESYALVCVRGQGRPLADRSLRDLDRRHRVSRAMPHAHESALRRSRRPPVERSPRRGKATAADFGANRCEQPGEVSWGRERVELDERAIDQGAPVVWAQ